MSIHLLGGGSAPDVQRSLLSGFAAAASSAAAADGAERARISALFVIDDAARGEDDPRVAVMLEWLRGAGDLDVAVSVVSEDDVFEPTALAGAHGVYVGGGRTPAYRAALAPIVGELRRFVSLGGPYAGYSAGAMVAAETALLGGWRIGGVPVVTQNASEDIDEVTLEKGLGILDVTLDVHANEWGTLTRTVAAIEAGLIGEAIAIDENTALVVSDGGLRVEGIGNVWIVRGSSDGVVVRTLGA